jgi:hypothetical protein
MIAGHLSWRPRLTSGREVGARQVSGAGRIIRPPWPAELRERRGHRTSFCRIDGETR